MFKNFLKIFRMYFCLDFEKSTLCDRADFQIGDGGFPCSSTFGRVFGFPDSGSAFRRLIARVSKLFFPAYGLMTGSTVIL